MENQLETIKDNNNSNKKSCFLGLMGCIPLIHYKENNIELIQKKETEVNFIQESKFRNNENKLDKTLIGLSNRQYTIQRIPGVNLQNQNNQIFLNKFGTLGQKTNFAKNCENIKKEISN